MEISRDVRRWNRIELLPEISRDQKNRGKMKTDKEMGISRNKRRWNMRPYIQQGISKDHNANVLVPISTQPYPIGHSVLTAGTE